MDPVKGGGRETMAEGLILSDALEGRPWRDDAEAFSESTGVVAAILRPGYDVAPTEVRCPACPRQDRGDAGDSTPCPSCFVGDTLE